jgi:hypothetical protein
MKKKKFYPCTVILILILTQLSFAQLERGQNQSTAIKPGLSAEYLNLTITGDEDDLSSKLKTYLFSTKTGFQILDGFSLDIILGYGLSDFDGLTFRQLPFSVELRVGEIGGLLVGAEINKRLLYFAEYEINLYGQFVYYYGFENEWEVPALNVEGTVKGTPYWMRGQIGSLIRYEGLNSVYPYLCVKYSKLWGEFTMVQEIQDLLGTEEKKITGKSDFTLSLGMDYKVTADLLVRGELTVMPFHGGVDYGGMLHLQYSFQLPNRRNR